MDHLTPSMLMNLAHLAGYLDKEHSLLTTVLSVQGSIKNSIAVVSLRKLIQLSECESYTYDVTCQ